MPRLLTLPAVTLWILANQINILILSKILVASVYSKCFSLLKTSLLEFLVNYLCFFFCVFGMLPRFNAGFKKY